MKYFTKEDSFIQIGKINKECLILFLFLGTKIKHNCSDCKEKEKEKEAELHCKTVAKGMQVVFFFKLVT